MSKVDQRIDELLDIQGEIVEVEKRLPTLAKGNMRFSVIFAACPNISLARLELISLSYRVLVSLN